MKKNPSFLKWIKSQKNGAWLIDSDTEFNYEDYVQYCDDEGIEPAAEDSDEHRRWEETQRQAYYEDDLANCRASSILGKARFFLTGVLGLWNGRKEIVPVIYDDFDAMMRDVIGNDQCTLRATYDTRCITFTVSHHDGTNVFHAFLIRPEADTERLQSRIDDGLVNPDSPYDRKKYFERITDFLL